MSNRYDLVIRRGTCLLPWGAVVVDIGVTDGHVAAIGLEAADSADEVVDALGLHVLPGLIDPHVHLRDPGDPSVESIPTGTRAAVLGGISTVFDMPNTQPAITDAASLAWKQDYAPRHSFVISASMSAPPAAARPTSPASNASPACAR